MLDSWADLGLWMMLLVGFVGAVRLLWVARERWKSNYSTRQQIFWYSLFGSSLNCFEAAIENLYQNNPGGPRIVLAIVVQIFTIWGTLVEDEPRIILNFESNEGYDEND